ncbi:MAG: type II secretion system protein [Patescibacteria group bacterium]|nr:type II secretion system protein [Patescibacteria group bacterium]
MKKNGFTLIELLVVISIIGLLSSMAVYALNVARVKAKEARCRADLKQILTAIEVKRDEQNKVLMGVTGSGCTQCSCTPYDDAAFNSPTCISRLTATFKNLGFPDIVRDPWGKPYLIDENEYEFSADLCRRDSLNSLNCGSIHIPFYICH